jgi:hypothetical protein
MPEKRRDAPERKRLLRAIERSFGAWRGRDEDGAAYVERLRRGLRERLDEKGSSASRVIEEGE